jgi:beta-lactamase class A
VWPHRLASGFPEDDVRTGGKTGTIITWRNEVGVATYADGSRYAIATFTRSHQARMKHPAADAAIGAAARLAVDALRAG